MHMTNTEQLAAEVREALSLDVEVQGDEEERHAAVHRRAIAGFDRRAREARQARAAAQKAYEASRDDAVQRYQAEIDGIEAVRIAAFHKADAEIRRTQRLAGASREALAVLEREDD